MRKRTKKTICSFLAGLLFLSPWGAAAFAGEYYENLGEKGGFMIADFLVLRPLGIVATTVGSVVYVLSLPFSAAGGNQDEAYQKLVLDPASYTFSRPLGEP